MLIPLDSLCQKYHFVPKGVLHVGAHLAEEKKMYTQLKISNTVWIEANPELIPKLKAKLAPFNDLVINEAIDMQDGKIVSFKITNNGESSSILDLKEHKKEHPHIHVIKQIELRTKRLDSIIQEYSIDLDNYDFINLDIQGMELNALKSLGSLLSNFKYIYTEVNQKELYDGCCLIGEIDEYLKKFGFDRKEVKWTCHGWGDAFYVFDSDAS